MRNNMIIETKEFKDVNRALYNPRVELKPGMPEYEKLKKSIEEFGHILPMVFNKRSGNPTRAPILRKTLII